jgi:dihydropteroate synthase
MADTTPFVTLPDAATSGLAPARPMPVVIGGTTFAWGERTYVMGIVNATPDSFSGDGLATGGPASGRSTASLAEAVVRQARDGRPVPTWSTSVASRRAPAISPSMRRRSDVA